MIRFLMLFFLLLSLDYTSYSQVGDINYQSKNDSLQKLLLSPNSADSIIISTYKYLIRLNIDNGKLSLALEENKNIIEFAESIGDSVSIASGLNYYGVIYETMGDLSSALKYYSESLKLQRKIKDESGAAYTMISLGYNYIRLGEDKKGLELLKESLETFKASNNENGISNCLSNIAFYYSNNKDYEAALKYNLEAVGRTTKSGDTTHMAFTNRNVAKVYRELGELDKSLIHYHKALDFFDMDYYPYGISSTLIGIAKVHMLKGNYDIAKVNATRGFEIANELNMPEQISSSAEVLYKIYEKNGEYGKSLKMHKLYVEMKDSVESDAVKKKLVNEQAKIEFEKQKIKAEVEHQKQIEVEKEKKNKQRIISIGIAIGLGLVGMFLLFVLNRLKVTRRQNTVIELQKHEVEEQKQEIMDSIAYAKRIQSAILPPNRILKKYLRKSFVIYKPKDVVAGDFYWIEMKDEKVLFASADCTGHGVPGAMVSVVCNNSLNRSVREYGLKQPSTILDKTRELVISEFDKSEEEVKDGMDVALCSINGSVLEYAGAHNPLWIIRKDAESIEEIKADKQPIGQFDNSKPFVNHSLKLSEEDTIYIFSDGYVDQFGGDKGKKYKSANFKKLLLSIQKETMEQQKLLIEEEFEKWKGDLEQLDDVCVIGVRI